MIPADPTTVPFVGDGGGFPSPRHGARHGQRRPQREDLGLAQEEASLDAFLNGILYGKIRIQPRDISWESNGT